MSTIPYTLSQTSVTVFLDGNTYPVDKSHSQYEIIIDALKRNDVVTIRKAINVKQTLVEQSTGRLTLEDGVLYCEGNEVSHVLVPRILTMLEDGFDVQPMMRLLDNLLKNPSYRAVKQLYGFLEACNLPITEDGHFLAYKIVTHDYKDCRTQTFDNSIGAVVKMPRNEVDENPEVTCSSGLHVCSQDYLPHYGSREHRETDRIVVVKVNPEHVVAVPKDYNNAKMRLCEYEVVGELSNKDARLKENFTSDFSSIVPDFDDEDETEFSEEQTDMFDDYEEDDFFENEEEEDDFEEVAIPNGTVNSNVLTYQDVWDIHSLLEDEIPLSSIAKQFNISPRQVGRIRDGLAHSHVLDDYNNR